MGPRKTTARGGALRVQLLSDLHGEIAPHGLPDPADLATGADLVVLAGDTASAEDSVGVALRLFPDAAIALVAGNHEHYSTGMDVDAGNAALRAAAAAASAGGRTVAFLEDDETVIEVRGVAVRLLGCTLWTDYALFGDPLRHSALAEGAIRDHRKIGGRGGGAFRAAEAMGRHRASRAFLEEALARPHDGPTIVVTHHLPAMRSVSARYRRDRVSAAFASRMEDVVGMGATLWFHGHTHDGCRWRAPGGALVACNPAGYLFRTGRENRAFAPRLVFDVRRGGPDRAWRAGLEKPAA